MDILNRKVKGGFMGLILGILIGGFFLYLAVYGLGIILGLIGGGIKLIGDGCWLGWVILIVVLFVIFKVVF